MDKTGNKGYSKRMVMAKYLPLILLGVLFNASDRLSLKQVMRHIGYFNFGLQNYCIFLRWFRTPYILIGVECCAVSVAVWLLVLSRIGVSYAYPLLSLDTSLRSLRIGCFFMKA